MQGCACYKMHFNKTFEILKQLMQRGVFLGHKEPCAIYIYTVYESSKRTPFKNIVGHTSDIPVGCKKSFLPFCPPQQVHVSTEGFSHLMEPESEALVVSPFKGKEF